MTSPAQTGILTTAQPPGVGVYVQAVIYAQATLEASAQWAMHDFPKGTVHFNAKARYKNQPPQKCRFQVSARYDMRAGTFSDAGVEFPVTAKFGASVIPEGSTTFAVTASYSFAGVEVQPPPAPPATLNVAVTRAATI